MLSRQRITIFFIALIGLEFVQFFWSNHLEFRFGDFSQPKQISAGSLVLSVINWLIPMVFCLVTITNKNGVCVKIPVGLLAFLFAGNLSLTFFGSVGVIGVAKSSFGFLTTLFPINYMVFLIAADKHYVRIRPYAYVMLLLVDITRFLFGAFFKLAVIIFTKIKFNIYIFIVLIALSALLPMLITEKYKMRNISITPETVIVQGLVSRIAMTNSFDYILEDLDELAANCNSNSYSASLSLFGLSLIPKSVFGLSYPKSTNNCLIETYLGVEIEDSSVNAPLVGSLIIKFHRGWSFNFLEFLFVNTVMLVFFISLCNIVFGANGGILKLWVVFEFFWTGNVLTLSIPIYFCILMLIISAISRGIKT